MLSAKTKLSFWHHNYSKYGNGLAVRLSLDTCAVTLYYSQRVKGKKCDNQTVKVICSLASQPPLSHGKRERGSGQMRIGPTSQRNACSYAIIGFPM